MWVDSITLDDGDIKSGVIESGSVFPGNSGNSNGKGKKKGQLFYLDVKVDDKEPGLYVYNGTEWVTSSSLNAGPTDPTPAGDTVDESALWMGS
jgi:hypothetical protein